MATLAVQVVTEEIEKVTTEENVCVETYSKTMTEAFVALSEKNIEDNIAKEISATDSGISICKSNSDVLSSTNVEKNLDQFSSNKSQSVKNLEEKNSDIESSDQQSQELNKFSINNKCSQESMASSCSAKSSLSSVSKKSSSSSSTLKGSQNINDEDTCSSVASSTSTIKTSQVNKSDDEDDTRSSFKSSRKTSPAKQSDNESSNTYKRSQSVHTDVTEDNDSRSSIASSNSRSTTKNSQPISNKSDDEDDTRSSFKSPRKSSPTKQSDNESCSTFKKSQSVHTDVTEDDDSRSSIVSSNSRSTIKNSQPVSTKSGDEDNSRSSFKSSRKSSPAKQSDNENSSTYKRSQSVHTNVTEDNDSCSSIISSNSRSPIKNSQPISNKSDDEDNSRSSFKSSKKTSLSKQSDNESSTFKKSQSVHSEAKVDNDSCSKSPEKQNKSQTKKYFAIVDSDSDDEIIMPQKSKSHKKQNEDSESKKTKTKNKRNMIDSDSDNESDEERNDSKNSSDSEKSDSDNEEKNSSLQKKSKKISNIVDSDSGSDSHSEPGANGHSGEENDSEKPGKGKKKLEKKRKGSARASKDKAMQEIHSETQRLIREQQISLPYHRPKQRTLQEFLNRKKVTSEIPKHLSCAEKVKMFPELINKVVQEKEKEAELFYKSSDSEEDEEKDEPMEVDQVKTQNENENKIQGENEIQVPNDNENGTSDVINLIDTQKLTQDHIQEVHNKREILQRRSLEFRVPRKLFMEDANDTEETEKPQESETNDNEECNLESDDMAAIIKKPREHKTGLRESSIPRKLFSSNAEEMDVEDMEVDTNENGEPKPEAEIEKTLIDPSISEKNIEQSENNQVLQNSTEDFVLNLSETEHDTSDDKQTNEAIKISDSTEQNQDQENIRISETPFINKEELMKLNKSLIASSDDQNITEIQSNLTEESKESDKSKNAITSTKGSIKIINEIVLTEEQKKVTDPILKLVKESKNADNDDEDDDGEIVDTNVLRDDFGLPPELEESVKKSSIKEKILANFAKSKPMIKASPGSMIDFTHVGEIKKGAIQLMDRFVNHSKARRSDPNEISEVKILRTEGSGADVTVIEEILPFKKTLIEDDPKKERKPGEKLKILREDLKRKIATVRNEEWKQKEENEKEDEEEETACKDDDFYKDLPDEEELLEDEESAESEPEEDDMPITESRRKKCAFGDEEAEESEDGKDEENEEEDEEDEEEGEEEEEEDEDEDEENNESEESEKEEISDKPKKLRRIITPVDDDSDDSNLAVNNDCIKSTFNQEKTNQDKNMITSKINNGYEDVETDFPAFQPRERLDSDSRSQMCKTPLPKPNNILSMISPVTQLTALHTSLDSAMKSASKTSNIMLNESISAENTPGENSNRPQNNCNMEKRFNLQKKLFEDHLDPVNDDEILEICSGKFTDTQNSQIPVNNTQTEITDSQIMDIVSGKFSDTPNSQISANNAQKEITDSQIMGVISGKFSDTPNSQIPANKAQNEVTDSQIMGICSGNFETQLVSTDKSGSTNTNVNNIDETSQDITLTLDDDEDSKSSPSKMSTSVKRSDESMFSSDSKSPVKASSYEKDKNPMETWLRKATENSIELQQKQNEVTDTQLMDICSGDFPSQTLNMKELESNNLQNKNASTNNTKKTFKNPMEAWLQKATKKQPVTQMQQKQEVTDSQLMNICSGTFPSQTVGMKDLEANDSPQINNENSEDFNLMMEDNTRSPIKEIQKKKVSKPSPPKNSTTTNTEIKEVPKKFVIVSSDDEENGESKPKRPKKKILKKKKVKKLELSDDEENDENEFSNSEESIVDEEEEEEQFVDYDSEENEVVVVPKKEIKKVAKKFLEHEAELSESEWGSDDEDEQDLDKFEYEEGDADDIDHDKVKNQLDRIHMKQVMDEDQREVKLLQEILFDDGDLHSEGAGRERKFKWKNIDNFDDNELGPRMDDNVELMDDEIDVNTEVQIRKMRYEQLKFLEEKEKNINKGIEEDFDESQLFKSGLKIVSVRSSSKTSIEEQKLTKSNSIGNKNTITSNGLPNFTKTTLKSTKSLSFSNMRGSFLSRGEETLVRIAQKLPETNRVPLNPSRTRKFVFEHLSPSVANAPKDDSEQENENTPAKEKKKTRKRKLIASQQTPTTTKKMKIDDRGAGKKLF